MARLRSILIIDDNDNCAEFMTLAFKAKGAEDIASETSPAHAMDRIRIDKPDLVLLDIKMPVMDGFEILRTLRGEGNTVPVIMCSGSVLQSDVDRAFSSGCNGYVVKPDSLDAYKSLASEVLGYWSHSEVPVN